MEKRRALFASAEFNKNFPSGNALKRHVCLDINVTSAHVHFIEKTIEKQHFHCHDDITNSNEFT